MKRIWSDTMTRAVGSPASVVTHTVVFVGALALPFFGVPMDTVLLALTTAVSLEAIYLALFIQMTVNRNTESLEDVEEEIGEIQEDIEDIGEEIVDINEDIEELEGSDSEEETRDKKIDAAVENIQKDLNRLIADIERLKSGR